MIAEKSPVLIACAVAVFVVSAVHCQTLEDPIAALKAVIEVPANDRDAAPLYREVGESVADGTYLRVDLEQGRVSPPLYLEIVECGRFEPPAVDPFRVEQGEVILDFSLGMDLQRHLLPHLQWIRGLQSRVGAAYSEGRPEEAWIEVKRAAVVGLHFYESKNALIYHLLGVAMLRLTAQQALRTEIPEVAEHRELFEAVVGFCQGERLRADELVGSVEPLRIYRRLAGRNEKKVVYDFITIMRRLIDFKDHALGGEMFSLAVAYVARAGNDQCWEIFFACLPRLENSQNTSIQAALNGLFTNFETPEVRRMLVKAYARSAKHWHG
jgi:hypothetical protein